ncbi:MAG: hypothetical protein KBF76_04735, partial [Verrucomicrobiales bacterium]|nr:hypothetical protein [Verrucomicrobiales bacterium]
NNNGLQPADYIVGSGNGYQKVVNGNTSLPGYTTVDEGTMISGNLGTGLIQIVDNSATDYVFDVPDMAFDTSADFYLVTGGNITMLSSFQNKGSGDVTLVAGWNGVGGGTTGTGSVSYPSDGMGGFNYCKPNIDQGSLGIDFNDCSTFGNDGKTLTIGSVAQNRRISIGSAGGTNTFAAAGIQMFASDSTVASGTQLGFFSDGTAATGAINIRVKDLGLVLNSGLAANSFAQIGHGGTFSTATGGVNAAINISFCSPGDVILNAENSLTQASGVGSYAQIGHGGNGWNGKKLGAVTITGARNVTLNAGAADAYAQIGHGGASVSGGYGTGEARGNIEILNTTGKIGLYGGTGLNGTAQIGHGGVAMRAPMSGTVTVEAGTGGFELLGNTGTRTYAMIGNGGYNIDNQIDGDVTVTAKGAAITDGIVMSGGTGSYSGAFIGNGIYQNSAAVNGFSKVSVLNGGIAMNGGGGESSKAGIGHSNRDDTGAMSGAVEVDIAEGGLFMMGGSGMNTSATIGHEKVGSSTTMNGSVDVDVRKGNITLTGGTGAYANATIGHAGRSGTSTSNGNVTVIAGEGDITLNGGNGTLSTNFATARIGHGGWESGDKTGIITVTASDGSILVQGGLGNTTTSTYNFAQIGHGGYGNGATQNIVDQAIHVTAGNGDVTVNGGTGRSNFGQIGHGGLGLTNFFLGSFGGEITVLASGAVAVNGGTQVNTHAQIGHGGAGVLPTGAGTVHGNVTVKAGGAVSLKGGAQTSAHSQIGNGGFGVKAPLTGHVLVEAGSGGIDLKGGSSTYTHALIGNGGYDVDNTITGTTTVRALGTDTSTDGIRLKGGNGEQSVAHIGHLNSYSTGSADGAVTVSAAAGNIVIEAGDTGYFSHAQIGHGGRDSDSDKSGAITVTAAQGDVILRAGGTRGSDHYGHAQIGHGGYANGVGIRAYSDDIRVQSVTGSVKMTGGDAAFDYVQIGHGGTYNSAGMSVTFSGKVDVLAAEDVLVKAGTADTTYGQIGHGGRRIGGSAETSIGGAVDASAIAVNAGRDVILSGGIRSNSGAKIGHGHNSQALSSFVENKITVDAGRHVELVSAQFGSYTGVSSSGTQIGHGGTAATVAGGNSGYSGDIVLNAGGKLDLIAGKNAVSYNYALVGHTAYYNVRGNHSGDITVNTGMVAGLSDYGIKIVAGSRDDAVTAASSYYSFAGIGHHGHSNGAGGGDLDGNIEVTAERGGLTLKGGVRGASTGDVRLHAAQIGHGDYNSDGLKTGNIKVCIAEDILLENGDASQSPVQIGHGGFSHDGTIIGSIAVSSRTGNIVLDSSVGQRDIAYTQIGHGGATTTGTFDGNISITAAGDVKLVGGNQNATYSQIGHGGDDSTGTFSGNIHLLAGGDFNLTGGGNRDGYAMVGHGTASPLTSGLRKGEMKLAVGGNTVLTDNLSGVRLGHGTTTAGGISNSGITLVTSKLDLSNHARKVGDIANEMGQDGAVTFAVLNGDLLVDGSNVSFNHGYDTNFVASGNVTMAVVVQNSGSGNVGAVSGWDSFAGFDPATKQFDGSNGLTLELDFNNCLLMKTLEFDLSTVAADSSLWGNNGRKVSIGDGNQTSGLAFGSAGGSTTVLGHAVELLASNTHAHSGSLIGALPVAGVSPSGAITVLAREGGVTLAGGTTGAYAQIGHHAYGPIVSALSGDIRVESLGGLAINGGVGLLSFAQIGHGGNSATLNTIAGDIAVTAVDDIELTGGSSGGAYAQIGHGGVVTKADIDGEIGVKAGGSVQLEASTSAVAYSKIGHGDDLRGALAPQSGTGTRDGNIEMTAGEDIVLSGGMVGHVNSESPATATGGKTWIGLVDGAGNLLTDPAGGSLIADAESEFAGMEEVRFYVPSRANNQVVDGATINGVAYTGGAVVDPWPVQRPDEYTNIKTFESGAPDEILGQRTAFGSLSDPAPLATLGYAFYYETIKIGGTFPSEGNPTIPGGSGGNGGGASPKSTPFDFLRVVPDDRTYDDWLRDEERRYQRLGDFGIYYEGYPQYGPAGESIYHFTKKQGGSAQ